MEPRKIEQLYIAYAQDVYRLALSYLHNTQDAEDICHGVFMHLLSRSVQLHPEKEKSFLLTCTANACKNHLRSFWRKRVVPLEEAVLYTTDSDRVLWTAIGKLPPKYRAVIHLYYYEGYTQEQIAKILKLSTTAVQTRMARARQHLKKELCENE